ncbi:hypothetical protein ANO11243_060070 [Dothideomycetidae sp. 11243]|nr:hypothetical protein ANO11243_060070 [fungal sp. No.11243]
MKSLLLISPLLAVFATGSDLACPKYAAEVTQIREEVQHTVFFCKYYLSSTRSRSPIPGIDAAKLVDTCVCVLREAHATIPSKHHGKPGAQPSLSAVACDPAAAKTIRAEYQDPTYFCKFDEAL